MVPAAPITPNTDQRHVSELRGVRRVLHENYYSASLSLPHPVSGEQIEVKLGDYDNQTDAAEAHDVAILLTGGKELNYPAQHYKSSGTMRAALDHLHDQDFGARDIERFFCDEAERKRARKRGNKLGVRQLLGGEWQAHIDLTQARNPAAAQAQLEQADAAGILKTVDLKGDGPDALKQAKEMANAVESRGGGDGSVPAGKGPIYDALPGPALTVNTSQTEGKRRRVLSPRAAADADNREARNTRSMNKELQRWKQQCKNIKDEIKAARAQALGR